MVREQLTVERPNVEQSKKYQQVVYYLLSIGVQLYQPRRKKGDGTNREKPITESHTAARFEGHDLSLVGFGEQREKRGDKDVTVTMPALSCMHVVYETSAEK